MEKFLSAKNIGIVACIMAGLGAIPDLIDPAYHLQLRSVLSLFSTLNLFFINDYLSVIHYVNIFDVTGYILMLAGGILCITSGGQKIKVLRFMFTLVFLGEAFSILFLIVVAIFFSTRSLWRSTEMYVLSFLMHIFWTWLSWRILQWMNAKYIPEAESIIYEEQNSPTYNSVGRGKRFLNWLDDLFIAILLLSAFSFTLKLLWEQKHGLPLFTDSNAIVSIYLIDVHRFVYYLIAESLLGITGGKLLTGTRVVTDNGEKPSFMIILLRTLCRFIPFDSLSFFTWLGWHDKFSGTRVVREIVPQEAESSNV